MSKRVKRAFMRNEIMTFRMSSRHGRITYVYEMGLAREWIETTGFWP